MPWRIKYSSIITPSLEPTSVERTFIVRYRAQLALFQMNFPAPLKCHSRWLGKQGKRPENGELSQDISKTCNTARILEKKHFVQAPTFCP